MNERDCEGEVLERNHTGEYHLPEWIEIFRRKRKKDRRYERYDPKYSLEKQLF